MAKTFIGNRPHSGNDPTRVTRAFKRKLKSGNLMLGGIVSEYIRPSLAKIYKRAGFDFIFLENEHTMFDGSALCDFILAAKDNGLPMIAKVGQLERAEVARLLEAGMMGIQLPRTENRADLEELIDYMKLPPLGTRAGAPCFGNVDYEWPADHRKWIRQANEAAVVVAHIETRRGYENAEEIITTPMLDMVYLGAYDFSISMGHPGDYAHPVVHQAMLDILKLCIAHDVPFGLTPSSTEAGAAWVQQGCRFLEVVDELTLISRGANSAVDTYRALQKNV